MEINLDSDREYALTGSETLNCGDWEDMWETLLEREAENLPILLHSPQLEFRGTLVHQLRKVCRKLDFSLATLHLAVAQLDLFMDAHVLRGDRLTQVALACLSIAGKSEEESTKAPSLGKLSKASGIELCGREFRQLEWMIGQHNQWKLLSPNPVSFAALLTEFVVMQEDFPNANAEFFKLIRMKGAKHLYSYLDLTLADVHLKLIQSPDVGCACVVCARTMLGLEPWPAALSKAAGRQYSTIASIARRLQRMMEVLVKRISEKNNLKAAQTPTDVEMTILPNRDADKTNRKRPASQLKYSVFNVATSTPKQPEQNWTQLEQSKNQPEHSTQSEQNRPQPDKVFGHRPASTSHHCVNCMANRLLDTNAAKPTTSPVSKRRKI